MHCRFQKQRYQLIQYMSFDSINFFFINNCFFSHEELLFPDMLLQIVTN